MRSIFSGRKIDKYAEDIDEIEYFIYDYEIHVGYILFIFFL